LVIHEVMLFRYGGVTVFDERGNQIPKLQGRHTQDLVAKILTLASPETKFALEAWVDGKLSRRLFITPEQFKLGWIGEGSCHARSVR